MGWRLLFEPKMSDTKILNVILEPHLQALAVNFINERSVYIKIVFLSFIIVSKWGWPGQRILRRRKYHCTVDVLFG